jgi:aromatic ring-opening dioxygenase LigB subunit
VPANTSAEALDGVAAGLQGAARSVGRAVALVAAGDLSAGLDVNSPAYRVEGADDFDRRAVAALRAGDHAALAELGPAEARRVHARGWGSLVIASRLDPEPATGERVRYSTVRGVGQVVLRP